MAESIPLFSDHLRSPFNFILRKHIILWEGSSVSLSLTREPLENDTREYLQNLGLLSQHLGNNITLLVAIT